MLAAKLGRWRTLWLRLTLLLLLLMLLLLQR